MNSSTTHSEVWRQAYRAFFGVTAGQPYLPERSLSDAFGQDAVFISIDIEDYCLNRKGQPKLLTEIGVSYLDTRDLSHTDIPGDRGHKLRPLIKDRHFVVRRNLRAGHGLTGPCRAHWHKGNLEHALFCASEYLNTENDVSRAVMNLFRRLADTADFEAKLQRYEAEQVKADAIQAAQDAEEASRKAEEAAQKEADKADGFVEVVRKPVKTKIDQAEWNAGFSSARQMEDKASKRNHDAPRARKVVIIWHDGMKNDDERLRKHGIRLETIFPNISYLDTQKCPGSLALAERLRDSGVRADTRVKLSQVIDTLGIQRCELHNGSNDARFTLEAVLALIFLTAEQESVVGDDVQMEPLLEPSWGTSPEPDDPRVEESRPTSVSAFQDHEL
ncbi:MAG: hypothetical protein M1828_005898 [Chrysothrix sp. TS-e1954]|nr:MAG: hypothetical protein M1828_005898 [Chrysothrix sp. TS-e1954]